MQGGGICYIIPIKHKDAKDTLFIILCSPNALKSQNLVTICINLPLQKLCLKHSVSDILKGRECDRIYRSINYIQMNKASNILTLHAKFFLRLKHWNFSQRVIFSVLPRGPGHKLGVVTHRNGSKRA